MHKIKSQAKLQVFIITNIKAWFLHMLLMQTKQTIFLLLTQCFHHHKKRMIYLIGNMCWVVAQYIHIIQNLSYNRVQKVFMTCVSWTLTPRPTRKRTQKSASTRRNGGKRRCIWRLASSSISTSPPLSPRWTSWWGWR